MIRAPQVYTTWQAGDWAEPDSHRIPVQEFEARNAFAIVRGHSGQRFPYMSNVLSTNHLTPQLGLNAPTSKQLLLPRRYLVASIDQKKPLRLKGFTTNVPGITWSGLDAYERQVANQ